MPEDGPGGTFTSGLRTDVATTDTRGQATIHTFQVNRVPGRFQVRIIASKEQARAGTVSFQYIAEPKSGVAIAAANHTKRWIVLGAIAGSGAMAAYLAGRSGLPQPAAPPAPPVFTIGNPTISVGKP